jgi:triphosphoribosyl-dephospho-CoA synthetase
MTYNPIDLIREAELKAEEILRSAELDGTRLKDEAHKEAECAGKLAEEAARAAADGAVFTAREACRQFSQAEAIKLGDELEALRIQAESRKEEAIVDLISSLV